jgi:hypothetical protein
MYLIRQSSQQLEKFEDTKRIMRRTYNTKDKGEKDIMVLKTPYRKHKIEQHKPH